jgi:hypothetical protein
MVAKRMIGLPEYRPLSRGGAENVAKQFAVIEKADAIFERVSHATESYRKYRLLPDYSQTKNALQMLSKSFSELQAFVAARERTLEPRLYGSLLRMLGEDLTYGALKRLIGERHVRVPWGKVEIEEYDDRTKLDRSGIAAEAGPILLVSFFRQMQSSVEASLASLPSRRRGRQLKHLFRRYLIIELADLYVWLFDEFPTSTMRTQKSKVRLFSEFCSAILTEMKIDLTGIKDDIDAGLRQAGYLRPRSPKRRYPLNSAE